MDRGRQARNWRFVVAGAVVLAAVGGATLGFGAPVWVAAAIGAVTALVAATAVIRVDNARERRAAALEGRRRVLDTLRAAAAADRADAVAANRADVLGLLRADRSPMPFRGRVRELRELAEWRANERASPVLMLSGSAGVGKTRLAQEFGLRAPAGWAVGWLHAGAGDAAAGAVTACGDPAVILVDDADGRTDLVPLLNRLGEPREPAVRVILVTRSAAGLRASLAKQVAERHTSIVSSAMALELGPEGGQDDQSRWFGEAVRAFATALDRPAPVLPEVFPHSRGAATAPFVMIAAQALLAVLGGGGPADPRGLSFAQVAEALMGHERRRWDALAAGFAWGGGGLPVEALRERAIVALALLGADDDAGSGTSGGAGAAEVLRRVPQLRDATAERLFTIASWVATLYPASPGPAPRIRPDMVGEWFVVSRLTGDPALADSLRAGMSDEQAARALGLLARAADWIETAGPLFGEFAGGDVRRQIVAAAQAALTGDAGRHLLDAVIAGQFGSADDWSLDQLTELDGLISEHVLLMTHIAITDRVVALYRVLTVGDPDHRARLAEALNDLGIRLDEVGRDREAVDAAQESVTLYRALATDNPAAHQPGLAGALNSLGILLDAVGRHREALDAAQESVTLYRALATANPAAHQPDLAAALNNLGAQLDAVGRHREALDATQESVTLRRALATDNPAAHQPSLAAALNNLGNRLDAVGRHREALDAAQESVTLCRALATDNPAAHQADLAMALNNLGNRLDAVGRHREALDAAQESVTLCRALATDNPAAHQADLAMALNNLGNRLDAVGRHQEALDARTESVRGYRALAARDPDLYQAEYQRRLGALRREYEQRGMRYEAIFHDLDGPAAGSGMDGGESERSVRDESDH